VVVVTMIVPALFSEFGKKNVHSLLHSLQSRGCAGVKELYEEC
jgi:hypothetical protein